MNKSAWLEQVSEEILEPDLPICDPHHHLWDHPGSRYLLDEILGDIGDGHNVVSTVFVECASMYRADGPDAMKPVGETEFVQGIAAMSASGNYGECRVASGIVSMADLALGKNVSAVLEAHLAASPNRFRGIRHATGWNENRDIRNSHSNPSEGLMRDDAFREGFAVLADMDLSFDAWFYHTQMDDFVDLSARSRNATIILDHFGGPLGIGPYAGKQEDVFAEWKDKISQLEPQENVHFKLGGINMKINGFDWHKRDLPPTSDELVERTAPWYEHCIDTFGADRCMFESNFPVDKESCSYDILWNAFKKMSRGRSEQERAALFHDTATRVYRLGTA
ncbi:MAG: amidohydrolase family protein [Gammaproteobacteria bacterium]|nr:amidohydrolase family protein [Gammaproteobacteria bacterium]